MQILALETSGLSGSVAALADDRLIAHQMLDPALRSARSLAPAIHKLLEDIRWQPEDVRLVAVTTGPGSFTGLRVGVTTAKVFAYAVNAQVLGVNTLEVLAWQAPGDCALLETVIDAHRQQLFVGRFRRDDQGRPAWQGETRLIDVDPWLAQLPSDRCLCGPVLAKLRMRLPEGARLAPEETWQPLASTVGRLAAAHLAAGRQDSVWNLTPFYGRASAAEEKRDAMPPLS